MQLAPTLCLFARVLDRVAAMALGAICVPDNAYLDQPLEAPLEVLRSEHSVIRSELEGLTTPLAQWRAEAPAYLGLDRLQMAVIQCLV